MDLKHALSVIDGGAWVSLRFIKADVKKGTGGQVIEIAKARICRNRPNSHSEKKASPQFAVNPNHNFHFTRNMQLPNNQIRKVHPPLITHLNQEAIV